MSSSDELLRAWKLTHQADVVAQQGNLQQAAKVCEKAVAIAPDQPWPRVAWAWYLSRTGHLAPAREQLQQVVEQDLSHALLKAATYHGLGELQESRRDWARARESYRTALRTLPSAGLARALLRLTPPESDQREAAERMAYGQTLPPSRLLANYTARVAPGQREPVAAIQTDDGTFTVVGQGEPRSELLPAGQALELLPPPQAPPKGPSSFQRIGIGRAPVARWTRGQLKQVRLSPTQRGLWITLRHTLPGAGAPTETHATLVQQGTAPDQAVLFQRHTARDAETAPGCRQGWRETLTLLDRDGDGTVEHVEITKQQYSQPQPTSNAAATDCAEQTRTEPPMALPLQIQPAAEAPAQRLDSDAGAGDSGPGH
jgi:tetratricopeptide (TPR) repeat protein